MELLLKMIGKYLLILRDLAFIIPFNISIGYKNTFQIPATLGRHSYFEDYLKSLRHLLKHIIDLLCNSKTHCPTFNKTNGNTTGLYN